MDTAESKVNGILAAFAGELELDPSGFQLENGHASLGVDKAKTLHLQLRESANAVDMFMEVCPVPQADKLAVFEDMLRGNVLYIGADGAALGYDPERGLALLTMRMDIPGMTLALFEDRIERFLAAARFWQARISEGPSGPEKGAETEALWG